MPPSMWHYPPDLPAQDSRTHAPRNCALNGLDAVGFEGTDFDRQSPKAIGIFRRFT